MTLDCRGVVVAYGGDPVLDGLDLTVAPGEVVAVLGPSGSGKSTLLSAVAGFVPLRGGEISLAGRVVASAQTRSGRRGRAVPPEARGVGMVFQHYALWPHLTAVETVAYPLRRAGFDVDEARRRALALLDVVGIADLADRRPAQLSGGQQQRVGLARAVARDPSLYLFDEPTAHLDTALRAALADELASRRAASGAAALYATHDAGEALAVADRLALLRGGRIVQSGTPQQIYEQPVDRWAAQLTGSVSVLDATVEPVAAGSLLLHVWRDTTEVSGGIATHGARQVLVRPDWLSFGGDLPATVVRLWYRGAHTDYLLQTPVGYVELRQAGPPSARAGERVTWSLRRVWVVAEDPATPAGQPPVNSSA